MAVMVCTQYPTALPPSFRMNVDLAVVFNTHSFKVRDNIFRDYAHNLPSWRFYGGLDYYHPRFQCLCITPCAQTNDSKDIFFISKAEEHGPFYIGQVDYGRHGRKYPGLDNKYLTPSCFFSVLGKTVPPL